MLSRTMKINKQMPGEFKNQMSALRKTNQPSQGPKTEAENIMETELSLVQAASTLQGHSHLGCITVPLSLPSVKG